MCRAYFIEDRDTGEKEEGNSLNGALYRVMLKQNAKKILGHSSAIVLYELLLTWVYPAIAKSPAVVEIAGSFPAPVKSVFGVSGESDLDSFEAYISGQFYGRIWALLMSVYGVSTAAFLLSGLIERGFMAYPLSAPLSRQEIISTQIGVLVTGLASITGLTITGIIGGTALFAIKIDRWRYFRLGVLGLSFFSAIGAYSSLFSVWADDGEQALLYSAGLSLIFYLIDVIAGLDNKFKVLRYFSIFSLFKPQEVLRGESPTAPVLLLTGLSALMFWLTGVVFQGKDVPV